MDANKLRAKLIEGIARTRRGDHGSAWPHLDGIGEARVVSVRSAEIFEPVQRRFRHVATDAVSAAIELVADQDAAARARTGGPPANAVTRLLSEITEDFIFEDDPTRQVNADCRPRVRVRRLDVLGVWLVQAGEIFGSHKASVAL